MSFPSSEINVVLTTNQAPQNSQSKEERQRLRQWQHSLWKYFQGAMTRTNGVDEPQSHHPSFHTKPWDSRHSHRVLARAMAPHKQRETPWPGPTLQTAKPWGCNMTLFPTSQSTLGLPVSWPQEQRSVSTTGPD